MSRTNGVDGLRCALVSASRRMLASTSRRRLLPAAFVLFLPLLICGIVKAGDPPPVVVDSIEPVEIVQGQVPQPEIQVFGSNFIEGLPSETNRPTVTLRHVDGIAEFSALAWVNFLGTVATVTQEQMNLIVAPLGTYDVIVTRPTDNSSATLKAAFTITDGFDSDGPQLQVQSAWGGPVNDVEVVGNLAYAAIGRRLVILDVADPANPFEIGSMNIMSGVEGVAVRDGYAFLGAHKPYRLTVADVSDPTNPLLVSAGMGDQFSHDVQLYGNLAYVRATTGDLDVFDITNPIHVVSLGGVPVGDGVAAIAIVGDLLYVGTGTQCCQAGFKIYDLSDDPLNPVLLDSLNFFKKTTGMAVEGDLAVWTVRQEGEPNTWALHVVDISVPADLVIVGTHNDGSDSTLGPVALSGGLAYVADSVHSGAGGPAGWVNTKGLAVFDIATDPSNPTLVGTFKTHGNVTGVEIVGDRAYVHDDGEGLIILDVSDPTKPVRLGNYHSPAVLRQMKKVGDLLYVADAWNGFTILDVANTSHPEVLGVYLAEHIEAFDVCANMSYPLGVGAFGIDLKDNKIYLGAGHLGLEVVDVADPANPTFIGALRIDQLPPPAVSRSRFAGVRVWGNVASIGFKARTCNAAIGIFLNVDISDPTNLYEVGRVFHGPDGAATIELDKSGVAFLGRGSESGSELTIDTSNPADPIIINEGDVHSPRMDDILKVADVALDGNTLFLAADNGANYVDKNGEVTGTFEPGLYIQDVTDPANPVLLAHVDESVPIGEGVSLNLAYAVTTQDERLYLIGRGGAGRQTAYIFDTVVPGSPVLLDFLPYVGGTASSVLVNEPYLYTTNEFTGPNDPGIGLVVMEVVGLNPVGDLDGDGTVGVADLLILLANWGPCAECKLPGDCPPDLDDDCSVGVPDLLILLANWGS